METTQTSIGGCRDKQDDILWTHITKDRHCDTYYGRNEPGEYSAKQVIQTLWFHLYGGFKVKLRGEIKGVVLLLRKEGKGKLFYWGLNLHFVWRKFLEMGCRRVWLNTPPQIVHFKTANTVDFRMFNLPQLKRLHTSPNVLWGQNLPWWRPSVAGLLKIHFLRILETESSPGHTVNF